jgi:teichoic acid transport system permease protein
MPLTYKVRPSLTDHLSEITNKGASAIAYLVTYFYGRSIFKRRSPRGFTAAGALVFAVLTALATFAALTPATTPSVVVGSIGATAGATAGCTAAGTTFAFFAATTFFAAAFLTGAFFVTAAFLTATFFVTAAFLTATFFAGAFLEAGAFLAVELAAAFGAAIALLDSKITGSKSAEIKATPAVLLINRELVKLLSILIFTFPNFSRHSPARIKGFFSPISGRGWQVRGICAQICSWDGRLTPMPTNQNFLSKVQVFEAHKASLPPLIPYVKEFWSRRTFAIELARFNDKAEYLGSRLGKVWLILNPLLLGIVYYIVIVIIRGGSDHNGLTRLNHLLIGLFTFYFAQSTVMAGAQSITLGGRLILNQAFPRTLLPFSCAIQAFREFLPTIPVYVLVLVVGKWIYPATQIAGVSWNFLWIPFIIVCIALTAFGLALLFATLNVYFRDTNKLLTYITRIWMYLSPILWLPSSLHGKAKLLLYINPLGPALTANSRVWIDNTGLSRNVIVGCIFWAVTSMCVGGYFFISRERDFAIRI